MDLDYCNDYKESTSGGSKVSQLQTSNGLPEQPPMEKGVKRAQETEDDPQALVHINYKSLSRESKKKLQELLFQWSEWHAEECSQVSNEVLESGEETYFPALHFGPDKSRSVSYFMDNQVCKRRRTENISFNSDIVPLYDRDYTIVLTAGDGLTNKESGLEILNASRCFNCGSYSHSLRECPKPHDSIAVGNARKLHQAKRKLIVGPRVLTRYYENSPRGKYDGLKPGSLNAETRKALGLGELDPPPWLTRMREMGYPPGYLDLEEDQPSGIKVYANGDAEEENEEITELNMFEPRKKMSVDFPGINSQIPGNTNQSSWAVSHQPKKKMSADFPGKNAPIPENTNQSSWATPYQPTCFSSPVNELNYRSKYFPELNSEGYYYQTGHLPSYTSLSDSLLSSYARSAYRDFMPNSISQDYSAYSYSLYSYRNSWPSF